MYKLISQQKQLIQRQIPVFLCSLCATIIVISYVSGNPSTGLPWKKGELLYDMQAELTVWVTITAAVLIIFGYVTLTITHARRLIQRKAKRKAIFGSAVWAGSFIVFSVLGIALPGQYSGESFLYLYALFPAAALTNASSRWVDQPYLGFRALRFNSVESALMIIAFFATIWRAMAMFSYYVPVIGVIGDWVMTVPNVAAQRAVLLGGAVFAVVQLLRTILGREPGLID